MIAFSQGVEFRIRGAICDYFLFLEEFGFFSVWAGSHHFRVLSRGALRCIVPACGVGMFIVVCGGVTWSAGIAFCENVKNVIFRYFVFAFFVSAHTACMFITL